MKDILQFASDNPFLTFFCLCVVVAGIVQVFRYIAIAIRGAKAVPDDDDE